MGSVHAADLIEERILEREHASIRTGLSTIKGAIEDAHRLTSVELAERVARTTSWMHRTFLPHAAWEEAWLYARVDHETGSPWSTRGLRVQHAQIRELARALETSSTVAHERWTREIEFELIAALARLDALVTAHMAEEEMFVLPLLADAGFAAPSVGGPGG